MFNEKTISTKEVDGKRIDTKNCEAVQLFESKFKKGEWSVYVRQNIATTYPSQKLSDEFTKNPFKPVTQGETFTSTRHAIFKLDKKRSLENVQEVLDTMQGVIYRIKTNNIDDLVSSGDIKAFDAGWKTLEEHKDKLEMQNSEGLKYAGGIENSGEYHREYKRDSYSKEFAADEDLREYKVATLLEGAVAKQKRRELDKVDLFA